MWRLHHAEAACVHAQACTQAARGARFGLQSHLQSDRAQSAPVRTAAAQRACAAHTLRRLTLTRTRIPISILARTLTPTLTGTLAPTSGGGD